MLMADHDGNDYDTKRRLLILFAGKHMCFRDELLSLEMNCMTSRVSIRLLKGVEPELETLKCGRNDYVMDIPSMIFLVEFSTTTAQN